MDWQGALRARLIAAAPVTALVGQRVFWVDRPQASALPAITLQTVTERRPQHFRGFDGFSVSSVQIDCWAAGKDGTASAPGYAGYTKANEIKEAVLAALIPEHEDNGIRFARAFIDGIRDLGERTETQFIHRASIDLIFHHSTTA